MNWKLLFLSTAIAFTLVFCRMSWVMLDERTARIEAERQLADAQVACEVAAQLFGGCPDTDIFYQHPNYDIAPVIIDSIARLVSPTKHTMRESYQLQAEISFVLAKYYYSKETR